MSYTVTKGDSLSDVVIALCKDFDRRKSEIALGRLSRRTIMEYKYLSFIMYDAASEIAGEEHGEVYIREIGNCIGYAKTEIDNISEVTYKKRKAEVKMNILRRLHMID
jgi:hypothetical protein